MYICFIDGLMTNLMFYYFHNILSTTKNITMMVLNEWVNFFLVHLLLYSLCTLCWTCRKGLLRGYNWLGFSLPAEIFRCRCFISIYNLKQQWYYSRIIKIDGNISGLFFTHNCIITLQNKKLYTELDQYEPCYFKRSFWFVDIL